MIMFTQIKNFTMKKKLFLLLLTVLFTVPQTVPAKDFKIQNGKFLLDGKPIQLICGEMHYPRIPKEYWRDRIQRAKAMGINTISTYVFWNFHERLPGQFDFKGQADLAKFIRIAHEEGMYVVLRPGPYVCAEWDFGGYPFWLQKNRSMVYRSNDEAFLAACQRYIDRLGKELSKLTVTNGGPILLVQVENEYGSYSNDKVYLSKLRDMIKNAGFNVPLITCDGAGQMPNGKVDGVLPTVNGAVGEDIIKTINKHHPGGPYFVAEFYPAWFDVWGKRHSYRDYKNPAKQLDWMLGHDISISMYMFHGGTNFSYTNGANTAYGYEPQPTSYDYDAPLGEYGNITPKYKAFREIIQKHLPKGQNLPDIPAENPVISIPAITLNESAPLNNAFGKRVRSEKVLTMEDLDQDFGYIHYETTIKNPIKGTLVLKELRDYAVILINGKQVGSLDRRLRQNKLSVDIPANAKLEILVENVGRVNYGGDILHNLKGITEKVSINGNELKNWTITPLPLYKADVSHLKWTEQDLKEQPAFFRGTFQLDKTGDTFLDMRGWGKGAVWINGHSIGKYWYIGPQQTLYVPGPWLKKGKNEIVVFEMENGVTRMQGSRNGESLVLTNASHRSIAGLEKPILDQVNKDWLLSARPERDNSKTPILDKGDKLFSGTLEQKNGMQRFTFTSNKTLRHLCIEINSSYDKKNACLSEIELIGVDDKPISKDQWQAVYVSTEEPIEGDAELLFDENTHTYWHSQWKDKTVPFPHRIIIDLGEIQTIKGFALYQRNASMPGCVKDFTLYGRPQFFLFK